MTKRSGTLPADFSLEVTAAMLTLGVMSVIGLAIFGEVGLVFGVGAAIGAFIRGVMFLVRQHF